MTPLCQFLSRMLTNLLKFVIIQQIGGTKDVVKLVRN
jgi:hypothetical protein